MARTDESTSEVIGEDVPTDQGNVQVSDQSNGTNGTSESHDLDRLLTDFGFRGPVALRMLVETGAAEQKLPVTQYLLNVVANAHGYQAQPGKTRKTMTEDERKAKIEADKAAAKAERERTQQILRQQRIAAGLEKEETPAPTSA